ncbi:MAG: hypothetical protein WC714_20635 [Candidatus Obscuribacterales bacterium]
MKKTSHPAKSIYIGPNQRLWAMPRHYQRFWGWYELDQRSGLYFAKEASVEQIALIRATFKLLPQCFQELCRQWKVTFSFAEGATASGNASTFYADFSRQPEEYISPHIEIGSVSLKPETILAHLGHEVAHLFWRSRSESQRRAYRAFLERSCGTTCVEVTDYVQGYFEGYLASLKKFRQNKVHPNLHDGNFFRWTEESFCDTVATKLVGTHPDRSENCSIDVAERLVEMQNSLQLAL